MRWLALILVGMMPFAANGAEPERLVLKRLAGVEVWQQQDEQAPVMALALGWRGGTLLDVAGEEGASSLVGRVLDEGAQGIENYARAVASNGVSVSFTVGRDSMQALLVAPVDRVEQGLELFLAALTKPLMTTQAVEEAKKRALTDVQIRARNPSSAGWQALREHGWEGGVYARPRNGWKHTLEKLDRKALLRQHERLTSIGVLKVAAVGAVDEELVREFLRRLYKRVRRGVEREVIPVPQVAGPVRVLLPWPDLAQVEVKFALPGVGYDHEDFMAAAVMASVWGGREGRLYKLLRGEHGLVYGVSAFLSPSEQGGWMGGSLATRQGQARQAEALVRASIKKLITEGVGRQELERVQRQLEWGWVLGMDSSSRVAQALVSLMLSGRGVEYLQTRKERLWSVRAEDVQRVAKKLLQEGTWVQVGGKW